MRNLLSHRRPHVAFRQVLPNGHSAVVGDVACPGGEGREGGVDYRGLYCKKKQQQNRGKEKQMNGAGDPLDIQQMNTEAEEAVDVG